MNAPLNRPVTTPAVDLTVARAHTRAIALASRENFVVASALLPRRFRQPFYDLYAYCRTADDLADESESTAAATNGLNDYRRRIARILDGAPTGDDPLFVALADTIGRFGLSGEPFTDLLDAFDQDQRVTRYDDDSQLIDYCRRSANPVGRMILELAGSADDQNLASSDQICTALQLANFWQDMRRDFVDKDRLYLPREIMRAHGFDESIVADTIQSNKPTPPAVRAAIADRCADVRRRLAAGRPLVRRVPAWLAADLGLFLDGGAAVIDAIEAIDFDVLRTRVVVSRGRHAWMVARAAIGRWTGTI